MSDRTADSLREITCQTGFQEFAEGSCLLAMGRTRVLCSASVEERVPPFLEGKGRGWVTAEYAMLPRSTHTRSMRERATGKPSGRSLEISRLIGRALRMAVDLEALGQRTVTVDCDVIQADGGTRCCAVNGGMIALQLALRRLEETGLVSVPPLRTLVAAVSVGLIGGQPVLDLDYALDSQAQVDLNVVMTAGGQLVELQGTAEREPFSREELDRLLELARVGIERIVDRQQEVLGLAHP